MSQSGGSGPDFHLPDEILSVLPTDPFDQLDLARKITSMAIASRVSKLESEVGGLKQKMKDKDRLTLELEDKVSHLQQAYNEVDMRLKIVRDDNPQDETVDIVTCDQSVSKPYAVKASKQAGQKLSMTPYITPRLTPTGTPKTVSTTGSPIRYSAAGSPQKISGTTSPMKTQYEGHGTLSSWYPSSQQSSAANSPPRGHPVPARTPRMDGKEFFRQARSRLSYEQFSAFLTNIKDLNAQKQSREETLRKSEVIFGTDNKDLYYSFQGLLNRNIR
ncbi:hypothetical protein U1Q18_023873 [Sarracenia purpurea var. burkii]